MSDFPGVWCCEKRKHCKWQGFMLFSGLAWGTVPQEAWKSESWTSWHKRECGGRLIQLVPPGADILSESANELATEDPDPNVSDQERLEDQSR